MKTMKTKTIELETRMNNYEPSFKKMIVPVMKKALTVQELIDLLKKQRRDAMVQVINYENGEMTIAYPVEISVAYTGDGDMSGEVEVIELTVVGNLNELNAYLKETEGTLDNLPSQSEEDQ